MLTTPPPDYALDHYTRGFGWRGVWVLGDDRVPVEAVLRAAEIVFNSMANRPDLIPSLARQGARFSILDEAAVLTDLPEFRTLYQDFPGTDWNVYRGLAGSATHAVAAAAEENLLNLPSDPYFGEESIALHEWIHILEGRGLETVASDQQALLFDAYFAAMDQGLWADTYAATNTSEYIAELAQVWFDDNPDRDRVDGIHGPVNTRQELARYDPRAYRALEVFLGDPDGWTPGRWFGDAGADRMVADAGDQLMFGMGGRDRLRGGRGDDYLLGGGGQDRLTGGGGGDILRGEAGEDHLWGGAGSDRLIGGGGRDILNGGGGRDVFVLGGGSGDDRLVGFDPLVDRLDLRQAAIALETPEDWHQAAAQVRDGLRLDLGDGDSALLIGLDRTDLEMLSLLV